MLGKPSVFLIGPMGSGKTAVGRHLARALGLPFHDSDAEIERRTGVDIPFIFEKEGEAGFRQREREAIDALTALPRIVLATGGRAGLRGVPRDFGGAAGAPRTPRPQSPAARRGRRSGAPRAADGRAGAPLRRDRRYHRPDRWPPRGKRRRARPAGARRGAPAALDGAARAGRPARAAAQAILRRAARVDSRRRANVDTLNVELGTRSYPILIDSGLIGRAEVFRQHLPARDVLILSDTTVAPLYLPALAASLGGRRIVEAILPDGEAHKTLASAAAGGER